MSDRNEKKYFVEGTKTEASKSPQEIAEEKQEYSYQDSKKVLEIKEKDYSRKIAYRKIIGHVTK